MKFDELHALVAAYALDALDGAERAEFEAHLGECADCRRELAEFGPVVGALADAAIAPAPPTLRGAVLSQIGDVAQDRPADPAPVVDLAERRRRRFSPAAVFSAAAAVALVAIGAIIVAGNRGGSDFDDVVAAPDARVVELTVQVDGEPGTFEVVWSPERDQVALRGDGVDDLDPSQRYALWAIADGTPIPAGLFDAADGEIAAVADLDIDTVQAWGITVESADGATEPTPPIIFLAEA